MWPMTPYIRQGITQGNREKDPGDQRELLGNSQEPWDDSQSDHSRPCHMAHASQPNYFPVVKCTWTSQKIPNIANIHPHRCIQARSKAYSPGNRCGQHNRGDVRPQSQEGNCAVSGNRTGTGARFWQATWHSASASRNGVALPAQKGWPQSRQSQAQQNAISSRLGADRKSADPMRRRVTGYGGCQQRSRLATKQPIAGERLGPGRPV